MTRASESKLSVTHSLKTGYAAVSKTSEATATVKKAAPKKPTGPTIGVGF